MWAEQACARLVLRTEAQCAKMPIEPPYEQKLRPLFMAFRRMEIKLTRAPVPERWIELLRYIDEKEREGRRDRADPSDER